MTKTSATTTASPPHTHALFFPITHPLPPSPFQPPPHYAMGDRRSKSEKVAADFLIGGAAAAMAKTGAAPMETVKLLVQNQGELVKQGLLRRPYSGIRNCFSRVVREEGVLALWRGNQANVIRYFPTQVWQVSIFLVLFSHFI